MEVAGLFFILVGVTIFYLMLHPDKVKDHTALTISWICYLAGMGVGVVFLMFMPTRDLPAALAVIKWGAAISGIAFIACLVFLATAVRGPSPAAGEAAARPEPPERPAKPDRTAQRRRRRPRPGRPEKDESDEKEDEPEQEQAQPPPGVDDDV